MSPHALSPELCQNIVEDVKRAIRTSPVTNHLRPLIEYEDICINNALNGDSTDLIELLESPPIGSVSGNYAGHETKLTRLRHELVEKLTQEGKWACSETMILRHFGGIYFSYRQAVVLDTILDVVERSPAPTQDTLKAAVLSAASALVNTIGKQFAQPIRPRNKDGSPKTSVIKLIQRDRTLDALNVFQTWLTRYSGLPHGCHSTTALRDDFANALSKHGRSFSVVYADPPYTRDHYSRFYHVLETISLRDNPIVSKVMKRGKLEWSRGYYREERHQSPFCIRSAAPEAFNSLFKLSRENDLGLVLSYSPHEAGDGTHPRVVSTSQITELANLHYRNVVVSRVDGITHNQLNRTDLKLKARDHAEIIIKCFR